MPGEERILDRGYVAYLENEINVGATIDDAAGFRMSSIPNGTSALGKVSFNEERIDSKPQDRKYIEWAIIIGSKGELSFHVKKGLGGSDSDMKKVLVLQPEHAEFLVDALKTRPTGEPFGLKSPGGEVSLELQGNANGQAALVLYDVRNPNQGRAIGIVRISPV